jgi:transcription antitermination factor NusG
MVSLPFSSARFEPQRNSPNSLVLEGAERWYVARSLPRQEAKAHRHLLGQGFAAFLPLMTKTIRHARQLRTIRSAVFPTYMFIVLDLGRDRWRSVNGTLGVASLIMARETPQPVPIGVVEQLLDYLDDDGLVRFDRDLREGQSARVASGPFANTIGRLERLDGNGRVRLLLDIMGGKAPALLNRSAFEAA